MPDMLWPLTLGIIAVFMIAALGISLVIGQRQERRNRALSVISRAGGEGRETDAASKALAKQRADIARKLKEVGAEQSKKRKDGVTLRQMMALAGYDVPLWHFWIGSMISALVLVPLVMMTSWPWLAKVLFPAVGFGLLPRLFLSWKAGRRQKKFLTEFADALDAMGRLLQSGQPMTEAIAMTAREFEGPLKEEMARMSENQRIGTPIGEAAQMMARRIPLPEVHMFATALQIQSETGSSLSEVLHNLSAVIRARFRLRRKVQALSSEAKSSAAIIGALPLVVTLGLYAVRPEYIRLLFTTETGNHLLYGCGAWMGLGILVMRQMINFKI